MSHPGVVAGRALQSQLLGEHELERTVLQPVQLGERHPDVFVQRPVRPGPVALEPPPVGPLPQSEQPLQAGQAERGGGPGVRHRPAPPSGRFTHRQRVAGRTIHARWAPLHPLLTDEPAPGREPALLTVGLAGRVHDAAPSSGGYHVEEAAFVLQPPTVSLRLSCPRPQQAEVEHGLRPGQAGEVPLDRPGDDDGVELTPGRGVGGEHVHCSAGLRPGHLCQARSFLSAFDRIEEGGHGRVRAFAGTSHGPGEAQDGVEVPPRRRPPLRRLHQPA